MEEVELDIQSVDSNGSVNKDKEKEPQTELQKDESDSANTKKKKSLNWSMVHWRDSWQGWLLLGKKRL